MKLERIGPQSVYRLIGLGHHSQTSPGRLLPAFFLPARQLRAILGMTPPLRRRTRPLETTDGASLGDTERHHRRNRIRDFADGPDGRCNVRNLPVRIHAECFVERPFRVNQLLTIVI